MCNQQLPVVAVAFFLTCRSGRDAYHFTLNGSLNPLAPVNGATVGAVLIAMRDVRMR